MKYSIVILLACLSIGWYSPKTQSNQTASQDVLASSSDTHNIGTPANLWHNGYFRYTTFGYTIVAPAAVASYGGIFASTDGHIYYRNAAGTTTQMDN
jgi:hypothetical protein